MPPPRGRRSQLGHGCLHAVGLGLPVGAASFGFFEHFREAGQKPLELFGRSRILAAVTSKRTEGLIEMGLFLDIQPSHQLQRGVG